MLHTRGDMPNFHPTFIQPSLSFHPTALNSGRAKGSSGRKRKNEKSLETVKVTCKILCNCTLQRKQSSRGHVDTLLSLLTEAGCAANAVSAFTP
jgi:hypothetical protein